MECVEAFTAREWGTVHALARNYDMAQLCGWLRDAEVKEQWERADRLYWAVAIRAIDGGDRNGEDQNDQARVLDR